MVWHEEYRPTFLFAIAKCCIFSFKTGFVNLCGIYFFCLIVKGIKKTELNQIRYWNKQKTPKNKLDSTVHGKHTKKSTS